MNALSKSQLVLRAGIGAIGLMLMFSSLQASAQTIEVYRFYSPNAPGTYSDHWSTASFDEGVAWNNTYPTVYEGRSFKVLTSPIPGDYRPLYRCRAIMDHYASTANDCRYPYFGLYPPTYEGIYGFISTIPMAGYTELYRFYRPNGRSQMDIIETTDYSEAHNSAGGNYFLEIIGYVPL